MNELITCEWVNKQVNEWMHGGELVNDEWKYLWVSEWIHAWVSEWVKNKWSNEWVSEWMKRLMDKWVTSILSLRATDLCLSDQAQDVSRPTPHVLPIQSVLHPAQKTLTLPLRRSLPVASLRALRLKTVSCPASTQAGPWLHLKTVPWGLSYLRRFLFHVILIGSFCVL